ncbi:Hydrolase alpha/beta fold family [Gracilaria domingensis]|nr:Hydrolase alpha/beta fold family [Gracilaria domingensis]
MCAPAFSNPWRSVEIHRAHINQVVLDRLRPQNQTCLRRRNPAHIYAQILPATEAPNAGAGSTTELVPSVRHRKLNVLRRTWNPSNDPKGGLLICCGLVWHSGWFSAIAQPLCAEGIRVVSVDNLSCGRSDSLENVRGLIYDVDDHVEDLVAVLHEMKKSLPAGAPLFVLGESSGGVLACMMALRPEITQTVHGWILCAPAITVAEELLPPPFVQKAVKFLGKMVPSLPVPGEEISGETWDAAFGDDTSADIARQDEFVLYNVPVRIGTASAMLGAMQDIENVLSNGDLFMRRVLVLHNRLDQRTKYEGSEKFVSRVRVESDQEAVLEDPGGSAHQLFQEQPDITKCVVKRIVDFVVSCM